MKISNPFKFLTKFELLLWLGSLIVVAASFLIPAEKDYLSLAASLVGVTALIFVAKGFVFGQILTVIFAIFYGIISYYFRYYGEMITYLCMTSPIAIFSVVSWIRHPYQKSQEVEIHHMKWHEILQMCLLAVAVTYLFYYILDYFGTAKLLVSTFSVTTSFLASYLTFMRSPYYALAYAMNDIVLIILWVAAAMTDLSSLPMVMCFVMFFANDLYGFFNWRRMEKRQMKDENMHF